MRISAHTLSRSPASGVARENFRLLQIAVSVLVLSTLFHPSAEAKSKILKTHAGRHSKIPKVDLREIQTLDTEVQVLAHSLDNAKVKQTALADRIKDGRAGAACGLTPEQAQASLDRAQALLDRKISDFVAARVHPQGTLTLGDSAWLNSCTAECHCAVYKTILETAGAERLSEHDRNIYQHLTWLAMNEPQTARNTCVASSADRICSLIR